MVKILSHKVLPEYDVTSWIDANIQVRCDIAKDVLPKYDLSKLPLFVHKHPTRNCAYAEAKAVLQLKKADKHQLEA